MCQNRLKLVHEKVIDPQLVWVSNCVVGEILSRETIGLLAKMLDGTSFYCKASEATGVSAACWV